MTTDASRNRRLGLGDKRRKQRGFTGYAVGSQHFRSEGQQSQVELTPFCLQPGHLQGQHPHHGMQLLLAAPLVALLPVAVLRRIAFKLPHSQCLFYPVSEEEKFSQRWQKASNHCVMA